MHAKPTATIVKSPVQMEADSGAAMYSIDGRNG